MLPSCTLRWGHPGFNDLFQCSPGSLQKRSNLTSAYFFRWVVQPPTRESLDFSKKERWNDSVFRRALSDLQFPPVTTEILKGDLGQCGNVYILYIWTHNPCLVYIPTLTMKINQMQASKWQIDHAYLHGYYGKVCVLYVLLQSWHSSTRSSWQKISPCNSPIRTVQLAHSRYSSVFEVAVWGPRAKPSNVGDWEV